MVESVQREVGADFWPKALLIVLILLTAALTIKYLVLYIGNKTKGKKISREKEDWWKWLLLVLSVVIYIRIQHLVGFIVAGSLFVGTSLYIMGFRRKLLLILISLSIIFLFALTFGRLLYVPLPRGRGIFRSLTLVFY
ncbi:hypothetical protein ES703_78947 [subsurface metagenome]